MLKPEWDALRARAGATASQSFDYAIRGWETTSRSAVRLNIVTARDNGRLVGVWPLYIARGAKGEALVRHLGCGGHEEYAGPLIDPQYDGAKALIQAMYDVASKAGDVLEIYNAMDGSPLQAVFRDDLRATRFSNFVVSPVIRCSQAGSWQEWFATKSKSFRDGRKQDRKRLMAQGDLVFRQVAAEDAATHVDWFFDSKTRWLDGRRIGSDWMRGRPVRDFYSGLVGQAEGVEGFALDLDGRTMAGCICLRSATTLEFYVTTFDPEFARYSPGNVMIEDLVRWCIERRLDFDFRLIGADYKLRWADAEIAVETTFVATTKKGVAAVRRRQRTYRINRAKIWLKSKLNNLRRS